MLLTLIISILTLTASVPAGDMPDWDAAIDKAHPRLLMSDTEMKALRKNIRRNKDVKLLHKSILAHADECVDDTVQLSYRLDASGTRLLEQSRYALERIFFCAYAWRMTGKGKYLSRVRDDILTVCAFPDWHTKHFLDTGEMALAVAIGLDWCYGGLPPAVRDEAAAAMERFALSRYKGQWFTRQDHNWNQVCYAGLAAAALAAYEWYPSVSRELLESAVTDNRKAMKMYGPDGIYPEGYDYWAYGTGFETMLLEMLGGVYGSDTGLSDAPGFMQTGTFMKYMVGTSGKCFSYSDSDEELYPLYAMWWFAAKLSRPDLLDGELALLRSGKYFTDRDWMRFAPFSACMAAKISMPRRIAASDEVKLFCGNGPVPVVLIRTGWKGSPSERYLAFKGGRASYNHGHMDAGSFVYDAFGLRWACDLGTQPYAKVENALKKYNGSFWNRKQTSFRWKVFRLCNKAHNTLTVGSQQHNVDGEAKIFNVIDTDEARGASIDLTPVFAGQLSSAFRKILLIDDDWLSVSDSLTALADTPAEVEWRMVTDAAAAVTPKGILLEQGGHRMLLTATPDDPSIGVEYKTWPAFGTEEWDVPSPGKCIVGYSVAIPAGKSCTIDVSLR
ncbi:MAG: heparinase II/III family protein [Bacteroidales bacterium]|nr:heparinase II/III family protein [Bacteroidales bacterium]